MAPRSRACAICRQRRIRCDATLPECLMCIRTNRKCPGPIQGLVIIDMTANAGNRGKKHKEEQVTPKSEVLLPPLPESWTTRIVASPSQADALNELFYGNFLSFFTSTGEGRGLGNRFTWLHKLPSFATDGTNPALNLAVKAAAAAFCGVKTVNPALVKESFKYYGQALHAHSRFIKNYPKSAEPTIHMVSTSVMLSLFEAMSSTITDAYREHIQGAARMLEITGPGQCHEGVLCQVFFHIRTQLAFVYLTSHKGQAIAVKRVLEESLSYEKIPIFQRLVTHIAALAETYVNKSTSNDPEQLIGLGKYQFIKSEVDNLWQEYETEAEELSQPLLKIENGKPMYRDGFTALTIAYFGAARILSSLVAPRFGSTYLDFTDHYDTILNCAWFLEAKHIGCAYMRMALPLYLVALHSPVIAQQDHAVSFFEDWKKGTMTGISTIALERIYAHRQKIISVTGV